MAAYCTVCGACGCGTPITYVDNKPYCNTHIPKKTVNNKITDQVFTPEQKARLSNNPMVTRLN